MGDRIKPLKFLRDVLLPPEMDVEKEMVDVLPKLPARKEDIFLTSYPRSGSLQVTGVFSLKCETHCKSTYDFFLCLQSTGQGT